MRKSVDVICGRSNRAKSPYVSLELCSTTSKTNLVWALSSKTRHVSTSNIFLGTVSWFFFIVFIIKIGTFTNFNLGFSSRISNICYKRIWTLTWSRRLYVSWIEILQKCHKTKVRSHSFYSFCLTLMQFDIKSN